MTTENKQFHPTISLWEGKFGDKQIIIGNEATLNHVRQELLRIAEGLEVGMVLTCSKNKPEYVKTDKHPTHRFTYKKIGTAGSSSADSI